MVDPGLSGKSKRENIVQGDGLILPDELPAFKMEPDVQVEYGQVAHDKDQAEDADNGKRAQELIQPEPYPLRVLEIDHKV